MGQSDGASRWEVKGPESVRDAVNHAIANLEECASSNLDILGNVIEPGDLTELAGSPSDTQRESQSISFRYCGYHGVVHDAQTIRIHD